MENKIKFPEDRFVIYQKIAKINFSFLTEKYGFKLSNIEKVDGRYIALKYLSERVFVNLNYSAPSFELDFNVGRVGIEDKSKNQAITSSDLVLFCDNEKWIDYKLYSAHSYENLYKCLPKLAEILKSCGERCLEGDSPTYDKMLFEKKTMVNKWCKEEELKQARKAASMAWKDKDYSKVIEIFEPIINDLSLLEKKKLEYARKHL